MTERTLRVSAKMAEEIRQWASDELGMWPRDTAYAVDLERLLAEIDGNMPAAQPAPDAVAEALRELTKQARRTLNIGAQTGSHWTHFGIAVMKAESALAKGTRP